MMVPSVLHNVRFASIYSHTLDSDEVVQKWGQNEVGTFVVKELLEWIAWMSKLESEFRIMKLREAAHPNAQRAKLRQNVRTLPVLLI